MNEIQSKTQNLAQVTKKVSTSWHVKIDLPQQQCSPVRESPVSLLSKMVAKSHVALEHVKCDFLQRKS